MVMFGDLRAIKKKKTWNEVSAVGRRKQDTVFGAFGKILLWTGQAFLSAEPGSTSGI